MTPCAVVRDDVIENIIVADPAVDPPPYEGCFLAEVPDYVHIGQPWNNGVFTPPEPEQINSGIPTNAPPEVEGLETL